MTLQITNLTFSSFTVCFFASICSAVISKVYFSTEINSILCVISLFFICGTRNKLIIYVACFILGFNFYCLHINICLLHKLPETLENKKIYLYGRVEEKKDDNKMVFKVKKVYENNEWEMPAKILLQTKGVSYKPGEYRKILVKLRRPRNFYNLGSFDLERYMLSKRILAVGRVIDDEGIIYERDSYLYHMHAFKKRIENMLNEMLGENNGSFIKTLLLGTRKFLTKPQSNILDKTGTAHISVVSGLHIGMLYALMQILLYYLSNLLNYRRHIASETVLSSVLCIFYALIVGLSIATIRAIIMLVLARISFLQRRKIITNNIYIFTLAVMLVIEPLYILSAGFWYSFVAVGALLTINYKQRNTMSKFKNIIYVQIYLFALLLPINIICCKTLSIVAIIANIITIPIVSMLILPLGISSLIFAKIFPFLGVGLLKVCTNMADILFVILGHIANVPSYTFSQSPNVLVLVACLFCVLVWLLMPKGIPGKWLGLIAFLPLFISNKEIIPYGQAELTLLDVGQGLAMVVRTKQHTLLYDTGAKLSDDFDMGKSVVVPYLYAKNIRKLDMIMISHTDNDHIGGLASILELINTNAIYSNEYLDIVDNKLCKAGQNWQWDGVVFSVLSPFEGYNYKNKNDKSCVLMINANGKKAILSGDIESTTEAELVSKYKNDLQADLLLVAHHGSKTSSTKQFLRKVQPKYALISAGYKNSYGHPKEIILQRLQQQGADILRTDINGSIRYTLGINLESVTHDNS